MRGRGAVLLLALSFASLLSCDITKDAGEPSQGLSLTAIDFKFAPAEISVSASGQVTLRVENRGKTTHNLSIPAISADIDYRPGTGDNVIFVPPTSGRIEFFCKYHLDQGMLGAFVVT